MQTIRSVQRSVDGGVDSNILQHNISIIEAVQIQLVRIETLFSDHESYLLGEVDSSGMLRSRETCTR